MLRSPTRATNETMDLQRHDAPAGSAPRAVPILMYHEISPEARQPFARFTVHPDAFAWQMAWLARRGFTTLDLDSLLDARAGRAPLPRRPVVVTFDDGFADSGRYAPPILERHGFTATFYLVAGSMGQTSEWLEREVGFRLPLMSWDDVLRLRERGHRFGSHTVTHPRLARVASEACREELVTSREVLERGLGEPVRHLAYPFGSHDDGVVAMAREAGYRSACTTLEALSAGEGPLELRRVPVYGTEARLDFVTRLRTARPAGELARIPLRAIRRWRRGERP